MEEEKRTARSAVGSNGRPPSLSMIASWGISYAAAAFYLRSIESMTEIAGGDLRKAMVFHAIWTANLKHAAGGNSCPASVRQDGILPAPELRPITVLALASALRMPYESVRRYTEILRKAGLCTRQDVGGLTINTAFLAQAPERMNIVRANTSSFLEFLADLRQAGFDFQPYGRPGQGTLADGTAAFGRAITQICSEFVMRTTEALTQAHDDDFVSALIHTSLYVANLREHFKAAVRQGENAPQLPLQEHLRPVSVRTLAQRIGLPFETVRRHCARMRANTELYMIGKKGLVVVLASSQSGYGAIRHVSFDVRRLVGDLHRTGLNLNGA